MAQPLHANRPIRTLHLVKTTRGAGWVLTLLRELTRLGVECHVAVPDLDGFASSYAEAGVQVHLWSAGLWPASRGWHSGRALRRLVDEIKPDVVHSHFVVTTLLMRIALRGLPVARVFQVPGPLHLESAITAQADVRSAAELDFWIGSCQWTCDRYAALGISKSRIFLAHYGFDPSRFSTDAVPGSLRNELQLPSSVRLVGMVAYSYKPKWYLGSARGIKGHEDFIDAIADLRASGRDVIGVVVGGAWVGAERYFEKVVRYGDRRCGTAIRFLGSRTDVPSLYADFDVAVHPSLSENLGGAGESLLHGVPTVSTNVGGFPDVVEHGRTGLLVPPRSPHNLAQAIASLLDDRKFALKLARAGQAHTRALLPVQNTAKSVVRAYKKILRCDESAIAHA